MAKRIKTEIGSPIPVDPRDSFADHTSGPNGVCPTSDHRKKWHRARATSRRVQTTTWEGGCQTKTFIDDCKCKYCGHQWQQEWMLGLL